MYRATACDSGVHLRDHGVAESQEESSNSRQRARLDWDRHGWLDDGRLVSSHLDLCAYRSIFKTVMCVAPVALERLLRTF